MVDTDSATNFIRRSLARMFGQRGAIRDPYAVFNWPTDLMPDDFMRLYLRNGIASRIVRSFPQATWRDYPLIRDEKGNSGKKKVRDKVNKDYSPFVEEVENFFDTYKVTHYMERADRLSGIGRFGILVMGFGDGGDLHQPLPEGKHKLIYLSAYGEPRVKISQLERDPNNPRYGLPVAYDVTPDTSIKGAIVMSRQFTVHHSRVIHLAEFLDENEVMGTPRLMPVYNHLLDLEKVVGSGAETFFLNARGGMSITADKDVNLDPQTLAAMKEQAQEFEDQLSRIIALQGAKAELLSSSIADPKSNVEAALQLISGGTGIPLRILIGSERGELSSAQDENNWAARIDERQESYATPSMVKPFVQKMIDTGNIRAPEGVWWVEWPTSSSMSPAQMAEVSLKKTQALATYSNAPSAELFVPPQEFRVEFLDMTPESEYEMVEVEDDIEEEVTEEVNEETAEVIEFGTNRYKMKTNAGPRTLYVRRAVLNAEEIREHFRKQGISPMTPAEEMHVTIAYSRAPVDWMRIGTDWAGSEEEMKKGTLFVSPGGARMMDLFGKTYPQNVLVLLFSSSRLSWRHEALRDIGASWDFPNYDPHITISYDVGQSWNMLDKGGWDKKLRELVPWQGKIELGPEIFSELNEGWKDTLKENARV